MPNPPPKKHLEFLSNTIEKEILAYSRAQIKAPNDSQLEESIKNLKTKAVAINAVLRNANATRNDIDTCYKDAKHSLDGARAIHRVSTVTTPSAGTLNVVKENTPKEDKEAPKAVKEGLLSRIVNFIGALLASPFSAAVTIGAALGSLFRTSKPADNSSTEELNTQQSSAINQKYEDVIQINQTTVRASEVSNISQPSFNTIRHKEPEVTAHKGALSTATLNYKEIVGGIRGEARQKETPAVESSIQSLSGPTGP